MGATTIWERWNGQRPDGSFETPTMNSFNHYAYGAIGDWMYRVMVGLDTEEDGAGYKKIVVKPHIGGGFTQAAADYKTHYGILSSQWKIENGKLSLTVEIPANTTATIYVPVQDSGDVMESGNPATGFREKDYFVVKVGSGSYQFSTTWNVEGK
jgi:alpha-L-rhamnosidase